MCDGPNENVEPAGWVRWRARSLWGGGGAPRAPWGPRGCARAARAARSRRHLREREQPFGVPAVDGVARPVVEVRHRRLRVGAVGAEADDLDAEHSDRRVDGPSPLGGSLHEG